MGVRVTCPSCEATFNVGDNMRGRRVPCRECKKPVPVPADEEEDDVEEVEELDEVKEVEEEKGRQAKVGGKSARRQDGDDEEDEVEEVEDDEDGEDTLTSKKKLPQKKSRSKDPDDDEDDDDDEEEDDEDEEDDEESSGKKKKKSTPPLVWIVGGAGILILVLVGLFLFMRSGREKKPGPVAENNQPTPQQVDPSKPPETKPEGPAKEEGKKEPEPKKEKEPEPTKGTETKKEIDTKKEKEPGPKKEDPKPDPGPEEKKDPDTRPEQGPVSSSQNGERIYQQLLKSTTWIIAPQNKTQLFKPAPEVPVKPPPTGVNPSPQPQPQPQPQPPGGTNPVPVPGLAGTFWVGKETLPGYIELKFQFVGPDRVIMMDKDGAKPGTYQLTNNASITLSFFNGSVIYNGTIKEKETEKDKEKSKEITMAGTAQNGKDNWTWEVTRQETPPSSGENELLKLTLFGTGCLVDRKHRLVLTNSHVVGDPEKLILHFPILENGELKVQRDFYRKQVGIKGKVVMREESCDLALIQLDELPPGVQVLPFSRNSARPAQNVHSVGNPAASRALWIYSPGRVRQVYRDTWKSYDDLQNKVLTYDAMKIETDSPINAGDSGGPLVSEQGVLVGVAHGGHFEAKAFSYFIDVSECKELMQKYFQSIGEKWTPEQAPTSVEVVSKIPDLIRKLDREDFGTRLVAVQALAHMGSEASLAFQPMFLALQKEENQVVRNALADALDKIPPRPGDIDMLTDICKDPSMKTQLRLQAIKCLGRLGASARPSMSILFDLLQDRDLELQRQSLATIAAIGPESRDVAQLLPALKSANLAVIRQAVDTIGKVGPDAKPAVPQLVGLLKKADLPLKQRVLVALQNIGPGAAKEASAPLNALLKDGENDLAGQAAVTLVRIGEPKNAVNFLIAKMKKGEKAQRLSTIKLLYQIGPEAYTATSELLLALDDDALQTEAKKALVKIGRISTQAVCKKMTLNNKVTFLTSPKTRLACVQILGEIRYNSPMVLEALQAIARMDPVPENRDAALKSLERITGGL